MKNKMKLFNNLLFIICFLLFGTCIFFLTLFTIVEFRSIPAVIWMSIATIFAIYTIFLTGSSIDYFKRNRK
jgi:ABC-type multidrug transport system permease subunit